MDLVDGDALIGEMQHLVVHVRIEVALVAQHLLDARIAPARPMVGREHDLGLLAEAMQRLADVLRPPQRIAHLGAAQRVDVVKRRRDVLGHPQGLHVGDVGVHLARRFGVGRVLEDHPHPVDLEFLDGLRHKARRRNEPRGAGGDLVSQPLGHEAVRRDRKQQAVLVEEPPVHGVAGKHVLGNGEVHEVDGRDDLHLAGGHVLVLEVKAAHAAPVIAMRVGVDDRRDRPALADLLVEEFRRGAHRFGRDQRIEHDPARLAAHEGDVGEIHPAHLVDAGNHFIEAVVVVQPRDAEHRGVDAIEFPVLVEELEALHVHGVVARVGLDPEIRHRRDEALLLFVEIARVGEGKRRLRLPQDLKRMGRGRLALGMEVASEWGRGILCKGRTAFDQMPAGHRKGSACCRNGSEKTTAGCHDCLLTVLVGLANPVICMTTCGLTDYRALN